MILDDYNLEGKVALVTGAATGLGQGMAVGLAEAGANVFGVGHSTSMESTRKRVKETGQEFDHLMCDIKEEGIEEEIVDSCNSVLGPVDILVNNAGIIRRENAEDFSSQDWKEVMDVNLNSLFFLTQAVGKQMIDRGEGGKVINICSMLSYQGGILVAPYTASKSGVAGLTRILGNEWAEHEINVNGIAPGYMATKNTKPLREDEERNQSILSRIPMDRWGNPGDLKGTVVYLASKASDYVTGTIIRVDGGFLTR